MEHAVRNYDGIQFEKYRRKVDPKFIALHDELQDCYYDYWKKGLSRPFQEYDVQATPKESKVLFDKLHGLIAHLHTVAIDDEHKATKLEDQDPKYESCVKFDVRDKEGTLLETIDRVADSQVKIVERALDGITIEVI